MTGTVAETEEAAPPDPPESLLAAPPPPPPGAPLVATTASLANVGAVVVDWMPQAWVSVQVDSLETDLDAEGVLVGGYRGGGPAWAWSR